MGHDRQADSKPHVFKKVRQARNSIQHFCVPDHDDLQELSLEFIYTIIDPLIYDVFDLCAIEFHEDPSVSYDYVVARLLRSELKFSVPDDFEITEVRMMDELKGASKQYADWLRAEMKRVGRLDLLA